MFVNGLPFLEYGVAVAAIGALVIVIRAFLKHLKCKDQQFTEVISNHLQHSTETHEKLIASNEKLSDAITRFENKL